MLLCEGHVPVRHMRSPLSSAGQETADDQYMLGVEVSERSIKWPVDRSNNASALQKYSDIRAVYSEHIDQCRFDELCAVSLLCSTSLLNVSKLKTATSTTQRPSFKIAYIIMFTKFGNSTPRSLGLILAQHVTCDRIQDGGQ